MTWKAIRHVGVVRIDRVAEVFEIWAGAELPFASFKVKVLERQDGFAAFPNVAIRNPATGSPEWCGGLGTSVEEALNDALGYLFRDVEQHRPEGGVREVDFAWSDEF